MAQSYYTKILLTGPEILYDQVITVDDGLVKSILPKDDNIASQETWQSHYLVPSFIDLQIYGAAGKLFSLYPDTETLSAMYEDALKSGTSHFMPTIATNTLGVIDASIEAIKNYWSQGGKGVLGLHLEGPWINKIRRGAHIESFIKTPDITDVASILDHGKGIIKMITLAPEVCGDEVIELIQSYGIVISAGHSNATFEEANAGFEKGIDTVTHLFNAMSPFHHRDTGLPGATFQHSSVMSSIIVDGYHVDYTAVQVAKKLMGDRLFLITDAVTETNGGPYPHKYHDGRYLSDNVLSGSALTMLKAVKNCVEHCKIPEAEAFRMASLYPARLMKIPGGTIDVNKKASFCLLNEDLELVGTCI